VLSAHWVLSAVLSVDFLLILSVPVRLSATSLSEVALKVWASPCTLSAIVGPASQTELSASDALALCVLCLWVINYRMRLYGPPASVYRQVKANNLSHSMQIANAG